MLVLLQILFVTIISAAAATDAITPPVGKM